MNDPDETKLITTMTKPPSWIRRQWNRLSIAIITALMAWSGWVMVAGGKGYPPIRAGYVADTVQFVGTDQSLPRVPLNPGDHCELFITRNDSLWGKIVYRPVENVCDIVLKNHELKQ